MKNYRKSSVWVGGCALNIDLVVNSIFSRQRQLLHQPDPYYFQTRLKAMPEFNLPILHQIQDALGE